MGPSQYIMLALGIIILGLTTTCGIEYGIIKGLQADKTELAAELEIKEQLQAGLYRDREVAATELAAGQEALVNCKRKGADITEMLNSYKKELLSLCQGDVSRVRKSWQECESKLKEAAGGEYETCEELVSRSLTPYYYQ